MAPNAGEDFPRDYRQLRAWFPDDAACLDYLDWLRWPDGSWACPACGVIHDTRPKQTGRTFRCGDCTRRVSRTAGTVFQDTRTPLTLWFQAAWLMATTKSGLNAKALQRQLGIGSYQTAWAMLHRYRKAMGLAGTDRLSGVVGVDETFYGGVVPGVRGRGALGKAIIVVAVELLPGKGFGRVRMQQIPNTATLTAFLQATVEPGSVIHSDGLTSYPSAVRNAGCTHQRLNQSTSTSAPHTLLPGVHRVASLFKRWALGTHQGSLGADHLADYINEFEFRFNRRKSRAPGMLFYRLMCLAVAADPITYGDLVQRPGHGPRFQRPKARQLHTRSLAQPTERPWRE